jgi:phosphoglycolate phosphatase
MNNYGIIFDLDGTLLDTLADIARAMNITLSDHGYPEHPVVSYRAMIGWGLLELVRKALPEQHAQNTELIRRLHDEMVQEYNRHPVVHTVPYPGIPELLDALHERKIPLSILSNKRHELVLSVVRETLNPDYFMEIHGAIDGIPKKPDPTSARTVASKMGITPEKILYIGDSLVDCETAHRAGMINISVSWGFTDKEDLIAGGSKTVIHDPMDVLGMV